jgi:hypothetical protein
MLGPEQDRLGAWTKTVQRLAGITAGTEAGKLSKVSFQV